MNKSNFLVLQGIIIDKIENLIKKKLINENQSHKNIVLHSLQGQDVGFHSLLLF